MSTERLQLEGSMVAIVTPFSGENVDYDVLGKLIEFQIEGGTQGLRCSISLTIQGDAGLKSGLKS